MSNSAPKKVLLDLEKISEYVHNAKKLIISTSISTIGKHESYTFIKNRAYDALNGITQMISVMNNNPLSYSIEACKQLIILISFSLRDLYLVYCILSEMRYSECNKFDPKLVAKFQVRYKVFAPYYKNVNFPDLVINLPFISINGL